MQSFREYVQEHEFVEFLSESFNAPPTSPGKAWSAKKDEVLQLWKNLRPNVPIFITPMGNRAGSDGRSYGEDGIRITGSWNFIASILGRLKELVNYENPKTKLRLVFRGVNSQSRPDQQTYVFYLNLENRKRRAKNEFDMKPSPVV